MEKNEAYVTGSDDSNEENTYQGRGTNRNTTEINAGWGKSLGSSCGGKVGNFIFEARCQKRLRG